MGLFASKFSRKKSAKNEKDLENQLQSEKEDMIQGIEDLPKTSVKEVMVPRIDVDFLPLNIDSSELYEKISESGHSRFPVYRDSIDNVVGVLYVKDIIKVLATNEKINLEKLIRKPFFVPESKRIDSLLREFKRRHVHIAMAIDEYGGISGIVCMEDIIEEIVGDIQDEFDNEHEDIIAVSEKMWLVDGRVNLSDLNEKLDNIFPEDDFDTLGGFVFDLFGKIPVKYEKVSWKNFDFIVQDMEGHRINLVKIIENDKTEEE